MRSIPAALLLASIALARSPEPRLFEAVEQAMGTLVSIKLYARDEQKARAGFRAAFARVHALDATLSDYRGDSELNRLCIAPAGRPFKISADLFRVLEASQQIARETNGAFDVTVGPFTRLWREARRTGRPPGDPVLRAAARLCGYQKLQLNRGKRTATLAAAGMRLDAGAIGKGYAADEALAALEHFGIHRALVAASGDLAFSDAPPGSRGWKIGIGGSRFLELRNAAVSTSGAAEQHFDVAGKRYSHIIDPATGKGLTRDITVTVIARRGIWADSMASAISVLGPERGLKYIEGKHDTAGIIVSGRKVIVSSRFPAQESEGKGRTER